MSRNSDISTTWMLIYMTGLVLWVAYGIGISSSRRYFSSRTSKDDYGQAALLGRWGYFDGKVS